ncbi:MAG: hypothetical protein AAF492_18205 [Verrucomicrobiota bacterium]
MRTNRTVTVMTLPDFKTLQTFDLPHVEKRIRDRGEQLAISPDGKRLAVITPIDELTVTRTDGGRSNYGIVGQLIVFDLKSGESLATCPRKTSGGYLGWAHDSDIVFFPSLLHEEHYDAETLNPDEDKSIFSPHIHGFNPATGEVSYRTQVRQMAVASESGDILVRAGKEELHLFSPGSKERERLELASMGMLMPLLSPDGYQIVTFLRLKNPFSYLGNPVLIDRHDPARRYAFEAWAVYRIDWSTGHAQD